MQKKNLMIIFGGISEEHEVSIQSAQHFADSVNQDKYNLILAGITKSGCWKNFTIEDFSKLVEVDAVSGEDAVFYKSSKGAIWQCGHQQDVIDIVAPIIHGVNYEDGALQGFLKTLQVPFVGSDVKASASCMDKLITKKILAEAGVPVTPYLAINHKRNVAFDEARKILGELLIVKPASSGSSFGVSRASSAEAYNKAIDLAFQYSEHVLIESFIKCRELECAILGNQQPKVSQICELVLDEKYDFYSYAAKYQDPNGSYVQIPASISNEATHRARLIAEQTYLTLECSGLARVDLFYNHEKNEIFVNEVNTMPGFRKKSVYPSLWRHEGVSDSELVDELVDLAVEKFETCYQQQQAA